MQTNNTQFHPFKLKQQLIPIDENNKFLDHNTHSIELIKLNKLSQKITNNLTIINNRLKYETGNIRKNLIQKKTNLNALQKIINNFNRVKINHKLSPTELFEKLEKQVNLNCYRYENNCGISCCCPYFNF